MAERPLSPSSLDGDNVSVQVAGCVTGSTASVTLHPLPGRMECREGFQM